MLVSEKIKEILQDSVFVDSVDILFAKETSNTKSDCQVVLCMRVHENLRTHGNLLRPHSKLRGKEGCGCRNSFQFPQLDAMREAQTKSPQHRGLALKLWLATLTLLISINRLCNLLMDGCVDQRMNPPTHLPIDIFWEKEKLACRGKETSRLRTRLSNIEYFPPNFEGLVLGCIDADFCK